MAPRIAVRKTNSGGGGCDQRNGGWERKKRINDADFGSRTFCRGGRLEYILSKGTFLGTSVAFYSISKSEGGEIEKQTAGSLMRLTFRLVGWRFNILQ